MKKLTKHIVAFVLLLGMLVSLCACLNGGGGGGVTVEDGTVYIFKDGKTDFSLTYSSGTAEQYGKELFNRFAVDYDCNTIDKYLDTDKTNKLEIVIGDTNRDISKALKEEAEIQMVGKKDFIWGYGYRDGKLAFYANNETAFELGWKEFSDAIFKKDSVSCLEDLWEIKYKAYTEYMAEIRAEEAAKEQAILNRITANLNPFKTKSYPTRAVWSTQYSIAKGDFQPAMTTHTPDSSHPRVYVNSQTLGEVRDNFEKSENVGVYEALMRDADEALNSTSVPAGATQLSQSMWDAEDLAFAYLATGKEMYGKQAIFLVLNYIDKLYENSLLDKPAKLQDTGSASTAIHVIGEVYDWCYDLLTTNQQELIINGVCNYVAKDCEGAGTDDASLGYPFTGTERVVGHGAERNLMRDWLCFAVAVADEAPDLYNNIVGLLINEYVKAPNWYLPSGVHHQGSGYGTVPRFYPNMVADMIMYSATGQRIFSPEIDFAKVVLTHLNRLRPDGEGLRIGDDYNNTGWSYGTNHLSIVAFYAGSYYGNATCKAWYKYLNGSVPDGPYEFTRAMYLINNDPNLIPDSNLYQNFELVLYNPAPSGSMVARSAWGDASAWMTYTNIEVAHLNNHDHKDSGCFQIYYKGILAPDAGMYEHNNQNVGSDYNRGYQIQTVSKNGLLIYNPNISPSVEYMNQFRYSGGQRAQTPTDTSAPQTYEELMSSINSRKGVVLGQSNGLNLDGSFKYAYLSGDITNAYYSNEQVLNDSWKTVDLVMRSTMTIATNDPEHPMAFIVYDRITSKENNKIKGEYYKKSFVLHTMEEPTFNGGSTISAPGNEDPSFTYLSGTNSFYYTNLKGPAGALTEKETAELYGDKYNGKLTTQTLLPENPVYRYIGGDGKRFWIPGKNGAAGSNAGTENTAKHRIGEVGWGRVEISPATNANATDSFLNVMYVGDAKDANGNYTDNTLIESQLVQCDTHEGAVAFGSCIMFSKSTSKLGEGASVSFTAPGVGKLNYYVGGFAEGTWIVKANGNLVTEMEVLEESGLLTFSAPAGAEITITPKALKFRLNYELYTGSILDLNYTTAFYTGDSITLPASVSRSGYKFDGWYFDAEFKNPATASDISAYEESVTLHAKYTLDAVLSPKDGQALNNALFKTYFSSGIGDMAGGPVTTKVNSDGSVNYTFIEGGTKIDGYSTPLMSSDIFTFAKTSPTTTDGKQIMIYKITAQVALVPGQQVLPFALNGGRNWYLLITGKNEGTADNPEYYVYFNGDGITKRIAQLPADGSLITLNFYVDFSDINYTNTGDMSYLNFYTYDTTGKKIEANIPTQLYNQGFGRVLLGHQVTWTDKQFTCPDKGNAAIRIGRFDVEAVADNQVPRTAPDTHAKLVPNSAPAASATPVSPSGSVTPSVEKAPVAILTEKPAVTEKKSSED